MTSEDRIISAILQLPVEMIHQVLLNLEPRDILSCRGVSDRFAGVI